MTTASGYRRLWENQDVQRLGLTLVFNTVIALVLTGIGYGDGLGPALVFSHCIGLSILFLIRPVIARRGQSGWGLLLFIALIVGSAVGTGIGLVLTGKLGSDEFGSTMFARNLMLGLVLGGVVTWFFITREWIRRARADIRERKLRETEAEKNQLEAKLRMLQAQVEPHFLFNTLAHLMSLIDSDVAKSKEMLGYLIDYLRSSLLHARRTRVSVADEMGVIDAYLGILSLRMGERMRVTRDVEPGLATRTVIPMLLHPLVENAIKHGLEAAPGAAELSISVREREGRLILEVEDNGAGFTGDGSSGGHGLANLRERLKTFYGDSASLVLEERQGGGVSARVTIDEVGYGGRNSPDS